MFRASCSQMSIKKAVTPKEYRALHHIADGKLSKLVKADFTRGVKSFKNRIKISEITSAIDSGKEKELLKAIPFDEISGDFEDLQDTLVKGAVGAGKAAVNTLPKSIKPLIRFDATNPRIKKVIAKEVGKLLTDITKEAKKGIREIIKRSFKEGLPTRDIAKLIPDSIGLNARQSKALINKRIALEKAGIKGSRLDEALKKYAKQKLKERKNMIARTETIRAVNMGQQEVWEQASEQGLLNKQKSTKVWVVTPDDKTCKICLGIEGQEVLLGEKFYVPDLGIHVRTPPAHPNCRCATKLNIRH